MYVFRAFDNSFFSKNPITGSWEIPNYKKIPITGENTPRGPETKTPLLGV